VSIVNGLYEESFLIGIYCAHSKHSERLCNRCDCSDSSPIYHVFQGAAGAVSVVVVEIAFGMYYW
jgi:hypothetical protein